MANSKMGLLGRKLGMTQLFDANGNATGVTVIEAGPNTVLQVKTVDKSDKYNALQLGFAPKKASRSSKAELGHAEAAKSPSTFKLVRELRVEADVVAAHAPGAELRVAGLFNVGDKVDVTGTSKGRGFAGVFKRYNFSGFGRSHGVHEYYRHGGSIGTRLTPGMTLKGVKMPGHMGAERTTIQNLKVVRVDAERNLVFVHGGVPGPDNGYVIVRKCVKKQKVKGPSGSGKASNKK